MRSENAVPGGYEADPTTRSVAVPIYQTVAYAFDSAEHGAALFNLETGGTVTAASAIRRGTCDVEALANVAHRHDVPLIVDNTVALPFCLVRSIMGPISSCTH
jgi:O-acetylhomoserine/O-acetylserine sulfhydrylase-like pyridoxal-dependent enzyme